MRTRTRLAGIAAAFVGSTTILAADWPNFRGPNHDGVSAETGLKTEWKQALPLVWERKVGPAFSSFACVGDRVWTCGTMDKKQVLLCMNAGTGEVVWQNAFEAEYPEPQGGDGTRATPAVNDGRVYVLGARGKLLCVDASTGKEIWSKQFDHVPQWGYSGSVLIEGDMAVTSGGKDQGALVAFDKKTGSEIWKTGTDPAGYSTPYPFTFQGTRYIVGFTGTHVIIVEAAGGKEVFRERWQTDYEVNAAAPIFDSGYLFVGSGYSTGSTVFKLEKRGDKLAGSPAWGGVKKVLMPKFQSALLIEGHLYCSDQKALVCVEFQTGKEKWRKVRTEQGRLFTNATLVAAEGNLFILTEDGQLMIGKAGPEGFNPTTVADVLDGRCWTVPVLHNGRIYARNMERAVCFNLRQAPS